MKSLDDIYSNGIIPSSSGMFVCSVCSREFKTEGGATRHFNKKDCHSAVDVFADSDHERIGLEFYKNILASQGKGHARPTLNSFRKASLYKNTMLYIVSCMIHEVDYGMFYSFLNEIVGFSFPNKILLEGQDFKRIKEFRTFLHKNHELTESAEYCKVYQQELEESQDFLISAIEKAKISMSYIGQSDYLLDLVDRMDIGYQIRVSDIVSDMGALKW